MTTPGHIYKEVKNMKETIPNNYTEDLKYAVLIDADNISSKYIGTIMDEISKKGRATVKRIYGDWTKPQIEPWKDVNLEYSITPIQQ